MGVAEEFLAREASSWAAFDEQVVRVPAERREQPGVVGDWTLKDVVWHCAHWSRFAAAHVAAAPEGSFADPFDAHPDEYWDGVNAEIAATSSSMSWDDVWMGTGEARAELRRIIAERGDQHPAATAWAAEESWLHYDEHAEHVRAFADAGG